MTRTYKETVIFFILTVVTNVYLLLKMQEKINLMVSPMQVDDYSPWSPRYSAQNFFIQYNYGKSLSKLLTTRTLSPSIDTSYY